MINTARPSVISMLSSGSHLIHNVFTLLQTMQCCTERSLIWKQILTKLNRRASEKQGRRRFCLGLTCWTDALRVVLVFFPLVLQIISRQLNMLGLILWPSERKKKRQYELDNPEYEAFRWFCSSMRVLHYLKIPITIDISLSCLCAVWTTFVCWKTWFDVAKCVF